MYEADAFGYVYGTCVHNCTAHYGDTGMPPFTQYAKMPPETFCRTGKTLLSSESALQMRPEQVDHPTHAAYEVDGFRRMFIQQATGLLSTGALPIPPGHPLYDKGATITALESERDRLLKENADLKRRLEEESDMADNTSKGQAV